MRPRTSKFGTLIARIAYTILFVPLVALGVVAVALELVAHGLAWVFLASDDALRIRSGW